MPAPIAGWIIGHCVAGNADTFGGGTRVGVIGYGRERRVAPAWSRRHDDRIRTEQQRARVLRVGGKNYEVTFEPGGDETAPAIDAAYEEKYKGSSAVPIMQGEGPKSATVRISPR